MYGLLRRLTLVVLVSTFGLMGSASAVEWLLQGARQRAMGGAGVATAEECSAVYWNPASLSGGTNWSFGLDTDFSVEFAPGTLTELEQLVATVDELATGGIYEDLQTSLDNLNTAGTASDADLAKVLGLVLNNFSHLDRKDLGSLFDMAANINVQAGSFGVSVGVGGFFDVGLVADLAGLALSNFGTASDNLTSALDGVPWAAVDVIWANVTETYVQPLAQDIQATLEAGGIAAADAEKMAAALIYISSGSDAASNPLWGELSDDFIPTSFANADLSDADVQNMLRSIVAATAQGDMLVETNETGIHLRGATVGQVAIAKSFSLFDKLRVGATAKIMTARTCNVEINYTDYSGATDIEGAMQDLADELSRQLSGDPVETTQLGIDIGVDFDLTEVVRLGLVMKNLNRPQFDMPNTDDKFVMEPQVRMGVAVRPLPWLLVATDIDLTENRSQIATDYGMRYYSFGAELSAKVVQFRLGFYGNLLAPEAKPAVTVGAGVKIGPAFKLDLALSLAGDPEKVMGMMGGGDLVVSDLPEGGGVSLSMQFHTKF